MRAKLIHTAIGIAALLCSFACVLFACVIGAAPVFEGGKGYEFYMGANSSSLVVPSNNPALDKLLLGKVAGEKAEYENIDIKLLEARFHARLQFIEEACGVTNYYYRSPDLGDCVYLNGYAVNLHIAVSGSRAAAGTPLIFGGI